MTGPLGGGSIGDAYAELHFRTDSADADLQRSLQKASKDATKIADTAGQDYSEKFTESVGKSLEKEAGKKIAGSIESAIGKEKIKAKVEVEENVDQNSVRRFATNLVSSLRNYMSRVFSGIGGGAGGSAAGGGSAGFLNFLIGGGVSGVQSAGASLANVGANGPFAGIAGVAYPALITGLVGAVAALLNVLAPLVNILFLLPSLLGTLAAAIAPVIIAFHGFTAQLAVVLGPDPEAAKKALAGMSEGVRNFALEIKNAMPWISAIHNALQDTLFTGLKGVISSLVGNNPLFAIFEQGSLNVVQAFAGAIQSIVRTLQRPEVAQFFWNLFQFANAFWERFGPSIGYFLFSVSEVGNNLFPQMMRFINTLFDLLDRFSHWLDEISNNGQLQGFMDQLKVALDALWKILGAGWSLVTAIVGGAGEDDRAKQFITAIVTMIDIMTDFFKSGIGKEGLKGMVFVAELLAGILVGIVALFTVILAVVEEIFKFMGWLVGKAVDLWHWLTSIASLSPPQWLTKAFGAIPHGAVGGIYTSPQVTLIGEAGPEALIPLNDPARAQQLANMSGLTNMLTNNNSSGGNVLFGPGSVQINVVNADPQQAYAGGVAAGNGVLNVLTRRNTALAIRSM